MKISSVDFILLLVVKLRASVSYKIIRSPFYFVDLLTTGVSYGVSERSIHRFHKFLKRNYLSSKIKESRYEFLRTITLMGHIKKLITRIVTVGFTFFFFKKEC